MPDLVALFFGAGIIVIYSYERFNRASYEGGRQLERLVGLISPDQMRARRIVLNAYLLYAFTLLLIYFFLCAYAEVIPLLGGPDLASGDVGASKLPVTSMKDTAEATTGFTPAGNGNAALWTQSLSSTVDPQAAQDHGNIGIDPSVSLSIALIIVGLAPTFPVLRRFEDWLRGAAHRLAGIPTRVIAAGEDLRRNTLAIADVTGEAVPPNTLLIPRGDWERMANYQSAAGGQLTAPEDFRRDLELIFAISAWILDRKLKLAKASGREKFERLEDELRKRKEILILELDDKSGYRPGGAHYSETINDAAGETDAEAEPGAFKRASWERLAGDADKLADDLCILIALYVEHEIIIARRQTDSFDRSSHETTSQQVQAKNKLQLFLGDLVSDQTATTHLRSHPVLVWLWTFGVVLIVTLIWSLTLGRYETELQTGSPGTPYWRAFSYIFTAFNGYCIPMLVALALRDNGIQSQRWHNMWRQHWTVALPQAAFIVFASWAVATLFIVGQALWIGALDSGSFYAGERSILTSLQPSFEYNAPTPLRGAILALVMVLLLDAHSIRVRTLALRPRVLSSLLWAVGGALIVGLSGGGTRFLTSWASALHASRDALDTIDRGLITYSVLYSAIIGFFVLFCTSEALIHSRSAIRRGRRKRPGTSDGVADATQGA